MTRGALSNTVSAQGTVAAAQTDDLSFSSAGTVTAVNVKAGDTVTAGQVLATIDSASLQSSVASAASTLAKAQATLSDDEASGASSDQITADQTTRHSPPPTRSPGRGQSLAGASLVATFDGTVSSVDLTVGEQLVEQRQRRHDPDRVGQRLAASRRRRWAAAATGGLGGNNSSSSSSSSTAQIQVVSKGQYTVVACRSAAATSTRSRSATPSTPHRDDGSSSGRFGGFGGLRWRWQRSPAFPGRRRHGHRRHRAAPAATGQQRHGARRNDRRDRDGHRDRGRSGRRRELRASRSTRSP